MTFPRLPTWQKIALPAAVIIIGIFYFNRYFVADELIRSNQRVQSLERELRATREELDAFVDRRIGEGGVATDF